MDDILKPSDDVARKKEITKIFCCSKKEIALSFCYAIQNISKNPHTLIKFLFEFPRH